MPIAKKIKLRTQKLDGEPFTMDKFNQAKFDIFQEQAKAGSYQMEYKLDIPPKTLDQLAYYYGGIVMGMVEQLKERGEDILGHKTYLGKEVPIMVNKDNCDSCLKAFYMMSINKPDKKFTKGNSNVAEMSSLIDWCLDYLPKYWGVYVPSSEEYKRMK